MSLSGFIQFILGFLVGVSILTGAGAATAYFFLNRFSEAPQKPTYPEKESSQTAEKSQPQTEESSQPVSEKPPEPEPEPKPEPKPEPTIQERFGEQAYEARVTWPSGLSLRGEPSLSASRVGGVYYDDKLVIIGRSNDGDWQKVYIPESGQQAWVKAGNVEKID
jgi:hypothetical protein